MSDYNNLFEKIKSFGDSSIESKPKIVKLKEILEKFEKEHEVFASGIFSMEGLEIMTAFQKEYIDREHLGAYGAKQYSVGVEFMEKVFSEPTTANIVEKMFQSNVKEVTPELKFIILDVMLDKSSIPIIMSPIPPIGIIVMIARGRENVALIKMNMEGLIKSISRLFNGY